MPFDILKLKDHDARAADARTAKRHAVEITYKPKQQIFQLKGKDYKMVYYSVWSITHQKWVGQCANHRLELSDRPYRSMTSTEKDIASLRRNSLAREFPDTEFVVREY